MTRNEEAEEVKEIVWKTGNENSFVIKEDGRMWFRKKNRKDRSCVPKKYIPQVIASTHDNNHFNHQKTYEKLKDRVWWPSYLV